MNFLLTKIRMDFQYLLYQFGSNHIHTLMLPVQVFLKMQVPQLAPSRGTSFPATFKDPRSKAGNSAVLRANSSLNTVIHEFTCIQGIYGIFQTIPEKGRKFSHILDNFQQIHPRTLAESKNSARRPCEWTPTRRAAQRMTRAMASLAERLLAGILVPQRRAQNVAERSAGV